MNPERNVYVRNFSNPDEVRKFVSRGHLEVLNFKDNASIGRGVFEPGWRWSKDVKPIANTTFCEAAHTGYCISGQMKIAMFNGDEFTIQPGEAFYLPPGHDAWVEGNEPCVLIDFSGYREYAKKAA